MAYAAALAAITGVSMERAKNFDILAQLDNESKSKLGIDVMQNDDESAWCLFGGNILKVMSSASITYKDSYMCMCTSGADITTSWQKLNEHEGQFTTHIRAANTEHVTYVVFSETHTIDNATSFRQGE